MLKIESLFVSNWHTQLSYDERTEPRNIPILTKIYALLNTYLRLYGLYSIDDLSTAGVM